MAKKDSNIDGETAESIIHALFNRLNLSCRVRKLGEKWPITDMYVEFDYRGRALFFFLQVKSTNLGYTSSKKLRVQIPKLKLNKFAKYKAPTYLVGVDLKDKKVVPKAFIARIKEKNKSGISSMPTSSRHTITKNNLLKLEKEIIEFWKTIPNTKKNTYSSNFDIK